VKNIQEAGASAGTDHREGEVTTFGGIEEDWIKAIVIQK
jgi:hypothetical protein